MLVQIIHNKLLLQIKKTFVGNKLTKKLPDDINKENNNCNLFEKK